MPKLCDSKELHENVNYRFGDYSINSGQISCLIKNVDINRVAVTSSLTRE